MRTTRTQDEDEERSTNEGGDDPEGNFRGGLDGACDEVGEDEKRGAADDGDGQHHAIARVRRESHEVGHDDANESDKPADRNRGHVC